MTELKGIKWKILRPEPWIPIILSACRIWESIKDSKIFTVISSDVFLEISRMQTVNEAESKCW